MRSVERVDAGVTGLREVAVERQADRRVGGDGLGVDAVVHHGDLRAERFRESAGLPVRRRDAGIGDFEVQQVVQVFEAQAANVAFIFNRELRVEADVGILQVIVELAVDAQLCLRPDVFQENTL